MILRKNIKFFITVLILLAVISVIYLNAFVVPESGPGIVKEFPNQVAEWIGKEIGYDEVIIRVLSPDLVVNKEYRNSKHISPIGLFIAYYNTLEKAELSHSPVVCFTGQGWDIKHFEEKKININQPEGDKISLNEMIQKKENTTMITLFWYQSANHAFANRGLQKLRLLFDRIMGRPDRNAFVRLTTIVPSESSVEETSTLLYSFFRDFYPQLNGFFL